MPVRPARLAAVSALAVAGLALAPVPAALAGSGAGSGARAATCAGTSPDLCVDWTATVSAPGTTTAETRAAAPVDLALSLTNTSTDADEDQTRWLDHATVDLMTGTDAPASIPASATLDDGLLINGDTLTASDCAPGSGSAFASCVAGRGTADAVISGSPLGSADGPTTATFGVVRIVNVKNTTDYLRWTMTLDVCVSGGLGACTYEVDKDLDLVVANDGSFGSTGVLTVPLSTTVTIDFGTGEGQADLAFDSLALAIPATAGTLANGLAATDTFAVMGLTPSCGEASLGATFTARGDAPFAVTTPQTITTVGCPTAVTPVPSATAPLTMAFQGAGILNQEYTGRTIARYVWDFDDLTLPRETSQPTIEHVYSSAKPRTVTFYLEDSFGAHSNVVSVQLAGSKIAVDVPPSVKRKSTVAPVVTLSSGKSRLGRTALTETVCVGKDCRTRTVRTDRKGVYRGTTVVATKPVKLTYSYAGENSTIGAVRTVTVKTR